MSLGDFYRRRRNWADAEKQYRAASAAMPKSLAHGLRLLPCTSFGKERLRGAESSEAKKMMPEQPEGYRLLGEFLPGHRDFAKRLPINWFVTESKVQCMFRKRIH